MAAKLGLLAGQGDLPKRIIDKCVQDNRPYHIIAFKGQTDAELVDGHPHHWVRLGAAGKTLEVLKQEGVKELLMAGRMTRPSLASLRPDAWTLKFFAKTGAGAFGDDGFLRRLIEALETEGFRVIGAHDVLDDLLAPPGVMGRHQPDTQGVDDLKKGLKCAIELGRLDIGQAVVVQDSLVLAVEAIEGTDAMLKRCGDVKRDAPGGVLVKAKKPQQESRVDLPTIGVQTVENAHHAGLRGIGVQAGGSIIMNLEAVIAKADELGLFLVGLEHDS